MQKIYTNKKECVYGILQNEKRSISEISKATGISRSQLTKWKKGADVEVRVDSIFKLTDHLGYSVSFQSDQIVVTTEDKTNQGEEGQMTNKLLYEHIDLLKDKVSNQDAIIRDKDKIIKSLKEKNNNLTHNPVQVEKFESLAYDWQTSVDIKWGLSVKRRIYDLKNIGMFASELGVSEKLTKTYFDSEVFYPMNEHPINEIITSESLQRLQSETNFFMDLVRKGRELKLLLQGMGIATFLIDYKINEKLVKTITYSRIINVFPIITVINKIQIIRE